MSFPTTDTNYFIPVAVDFALYAPTSWTMYGWSHLPKYQGPIIKFMLL